MRILAFIKSLIPFLKKDDVLEDLRVTQKEIELTVAPSFETADKFLGNKKFKSAEAQGINTAFFRNYRGQGSKKTSFISEINSHMKEVVLNLKYTMEQLEDMLEQDVIPEGLTAKKALLINFAESFSEFSRRSIDLLSYAYTAEAKAEGGSAEVNTVSPAMEKTLMILIPEFANAFTAISTPNAKFKKMVEEAPDAVVNDKTAAATAAVFGDDKVNSSSLPMQQFERNPIYHLRLVIAEWQANRYKAMQTKKRLLELQLLNLKSLQEEEPDPAIEKEILYLQNRIEGIEYKMKQMEE